MGEALRKHRVLVVEDEDSIALALDYLMTREGYDHDRIASGSEAMARIRESHPDLVLLDVMLPEISGYEICQSVRLDPSLSGHQDPDDDGARIAYRTAQGHGLGGRRLYHQAFRPE